MHHFLKLVFILAMVYSQIVLADNVASKPKLIVFMVVDGLPQRQITAYQDQLASDGLNRFLNRGTWFSNAFYAHATTLTAPGHATMLSGAYPHQTGIIANDWRNQATGEFEYCTGDVLHSYIENPTSPRDGTSSKNLKVETLGDVLKRSDKSSKVIAISGKDRGAILPAGKTGTAYMYQTKSGQFASSDYYMARHPRWVNEFNQAKPADSYFKKVWQPLLPQEAYARSLPDGLSWYGKGGALPKVIKGVSEDAPDSTYYGELLRSPFADELTLNFARAAIRGERLGKDSSPDILSISLSTHDYINHLYSAESRLSHDHLLQLDALLQSFFLDLDRMVGRENYVAVLTADHGFMPAPEVSAMDGQSSGRIDRKLVLEHLNSGLGKKFGTGAWASFSGESVLLNRQLISSAGVNQNELTEEARRILLEEPGFAYAYTRRELTGGGLKDAPFYESMRRAWNPDVSGDIQFVLKPYWMMASTMSVVTTHGSPYDYDKHVPILIYAPGQYQLGKIDERVEVVDLVPTLANLLKIPLPSASEGRPLPMSKH